MDTHTQNDPNNPINHKESAEDRAAAKNELMRDTLQALSLEYIGEDATDYFSSIEDIGEKDADQIQEELQENGFFDVEIIYYYKAMEYLKEHDPSLSESLEIAAEMGFTLVAPPKGCYYLNSECLASLHASRERENKFFEFVAPELNKIYNN